MNLLDSLLATTTERKENVPQTSSPSSPTSPKAAKEGGVCPSCSTSSAPASAPVHHVAEALPFLAMTLDEFQAKGAMLEVRVLWLPVTLWMVPTDRDEAELMAEGIRRGRIWTAAELMQLMTIADRTQETVKTVTHAKLEMDGQIVGVRRREPIP